MQLQYVNEIRPLIGILRMRSLWRLSRRVRMRGQRFEETGGVYGTYGEDFRKPITKPLELALGPESPKGRWTLIEAA